MRLISYNIGIKINNSKEVGEFIKEKKADIVAFQEIIRHFDDKVFDQYKSQFHIHEIIKKDLPFYFFGPQWISDGMRKNNKLYRDFNGFIEQGNEIISKFPIINAVNEYYHQDYRYERDWTNFQTEDHPRSIIIVELNVNEKVLQILNLHGLYSKEKRDSEKSIKQCEYILNAAKRKNLPTIIVGDLNLLPTTKSIQIINKEFRNLIDEYKIKSTIPEFDHGTEIKRGEYVVDYIFVNDKIKVNNFEVIETNISDHLPLILDFEIR
jgi:endonuclease/exonuclease/phosphatase family metal-dependent hydrolase